MEPLPQIDLNKVIADLKSHSLTVNWLFLAVLVVVLALVGGLFLHSMQTYERLMSRADTQNEQYHQDLKDLQNQLRTDQDTIHRIEQQKAQVQQQVVYRDRAVDGQIVAVSAPNRSESQVSDDVQAAYKFPPVKFDTGLLSFTVPETQTFVATKLDRDRLSTDLQDTQKELSLESTNTALVGHDLTMAMKRVQESEKVIADYKKVAQKSKFKRFLSSVEKAALFVGGVYLGRII